MQWTNFKIEAIQLILTAVVSDGQRDRQTDRVAARRHHL